MRKYIFTALLCCVGLLANAQDSDHILMIIAGKMISVDEFQASCRRNNQTVGTTKEQVEESLKHFVDCRLQVAEAEAMKLDTLREFRQKMTALAFLAQSGTGETTGSGRKSLANQPSVRIAHLFVPLRQHASYSEEQTLRARLDSVYNAIRSGADFMQAAARVASGQVTIEWLGRNQTLADVETMAFRLSEGEVSSPLLSTDGFHLMQCLKIGYEESTLATSAPYWPTANLSDAQQEYRRGVLIQLLYDRVMKDKARNDIMGLQQYFLENQKKYAWDIPRYKGILYQSKDKKTHKAVKKLLAKHPMSRWQAVMSDSAYWHVFQNVKSTSLHLFVLGENEHVDELAFGGPKVQRDREYPLAGIVGKELKKYPDSVKDVESMVVSDYQDYLERQWLDGLRKRHEVVINDRALKKLYR